MTSAPRRLPARGASLLEILVGLAIFATAFLLSLGVFPTSAQAIAQARAEACAVRLAEKQMEALRALPFDSVVSSLGSASATATAAGRPVSMDFQVQTTVSEPETELKRVAVLVSWSGTTTHYVRLETYLAKNE